jgi:hypothetical protein
MPEAAVGASPANAASAAQQTVRSSPAAPAAEAEAPEAGSAESVAAAPAHTAAGSIVPPSQQAQKVQDTASINWDHLSAQLSAAGFGHLAMVQQQQKHNKEPELAGLYDSLSKVCDMNVMHTTFC